MRPLILLVTVLATSIPTMAGVPTSTQVAALEGDPGPFNPNEPPNTPARRR